MGHLGRGIPHRDPRGHPAAPRASRRQHGHGASRKHPRAPAHVRSLYRLSRYRPRRVRAHRHAGPVQRRAARYTTPPPSRVSARDGHPRSTHRSANRESRRTVAMRGSYMLAPMCVLGAPCQPQTRWTPGSLAQQGRRARTSPGPIVAGERQSIAPADFRQSGRSTSRRRRHCAGAAPVGAVPARKLLTAALRKDRASMQRVAPPVPWRAARGRMRRVEPGVTIGLERFGSSGEIDRVEHRT
jgi:hypothetical protein